jgi:hypothetical protein
MTMKTILTRIAITGVMAAFLVSATAQAQTAEKKEVKRPAAAASATGRASAGLPGKGAIEAIDKVAKTIKVGEKTYQITSTTKIMKAGKPATLEDAKVGDEVGLYFKKTDDGKMELLTLRVGPKPEATKPAAKPAKKSS